MWKEIRKDWEVILDNAKFFISDGSKVSFWKDIWCGEEALCMAYPTLFSLAVQKEALIREVWDNSSEDGCIPCFSRSFKDTKVMEVENFLHAIQPWRVVSNKEDNLILKGSNSGIYSMKLMYEVLNCLASSLMPFSRNINLEVGTLWFLSRWAFLLGWRLGERC